MLDSSPALMVPRVGGARAHSTDHITTLLPEDSCDDNDDDDGDDEELAIVFMNGLMQ